MNREKICFYESCKNIVTRKDSRICESCIYKRRKSKLCTDELPICSIHGQLKLEEVFNYAGKYKCRICKNNRKKELRRIQGTENFERAKDYGRKYWLMKNFKITLEDYKLMLKKQNGVCAICKKDETSLVNFKRYGDTKTRNLAVDHCAITNKIRGLLCIKCNSMIGSSKDNPTILRIAADYLEN